ncbi:MAG: hypothetical protein AAFY59_12595 [Pseudomonadota bacterium]
MKLTHPLAYMALSGGYTAQCLGLDKTSAGWLMAALYLALALADLWAHRPRKDP